MNYEIYFKNDEKYPSNRVRFEDGTDYCVQTDDAGREYFPIPNIYIFNPENNPFKKMFIGRITDAITAIRDGYGDVLSVRNMFGTTETVYRFVDRTYGEEMRQKTIKGWKDTEFGYSIKFGYLDSMSGNRYVSKDEKVLSIFDNQNDYIFFNTKEQAENFKEEILKKAKEFTDGYEKVKNDEEKTVNYFKAQDNGSVYSQIGFLMIPEGEEKKWKLEIVQAVKI